VKFPRASLLLIFLVRPALLAVGGPASAPASAITPAFAASDEQLYRGFLQVQQQIEAGFLESALAQLSGLIKQFPDEAALYDARALLYQQFPLRSGAEDAAISDAKNAVRLAPSAGAYQRTLGVLLLGVDRADLSTQRAAQAALEKAAALDPLDGVSRAMLFYLHRDLREPDAAIRAARDALKLQPANLGLRENLASLLAQKDEPAAIEEWLLLLTRGQGAAAAAAADALTRRLQRGKLDGATELRIREAFYLDNPDDLANLKAYLELLVKQRQPAQALAVAEALKARSPDDPGSARLLLTVAWSGGRLDLALREAQGLREKYPDEPAYADALARLQLERADPAGALKTLGEKPFSEGSLSAAQRLSRARALAALGRLPEALQSLAGHSSFAADLLWITLFETHGGRLPTGEEMHLAKLDRVELLPLFGAEASADEIGRVLESAADAKKQPPEPATISQFIGALRLHSPGLALAAARKFAARFPDSSPLQVQLAEALDGAGQPQGAIAQYETLRLKDADNAEYANNLAYLLALRAPARLPEAVALASRALALEPENASYLDTLGWAHHLAGRDEVAEGLLEQAVRNGGRLHTLLHHLAAIKQKRGAPGEARQLLREALQQAPDQAARMEVEAAMKSLFPAAPPPAPRPRRPAPAAKH
jgi:predicted Zn-dependent protease